MFEKINKMSLTQQYENNTIDKYEDRHAFLFEIAVNISQFFGKSKRGGGIQTILKDNIKGFTDSFMNEFDKIRNGQAYLIRDIYQNTIFSNLGSYTVNDQIRFTVILLRDLKVKYEIYNGKVQVYGGKIKKNKKKKGGGLELVMISGIIIGAIWSLIQIYEKLDDWMKKRNGYSKSSPFKKPSYDTPIPIPIQSPERPRQSPERPRQSPERPRQSPERPRQSPERPRQSPERPRQSPERPRQSPERPRPTSQMMRISGEENKTQQTPSQKKNKRLGLFKLKNFFRRLPKI